MCAQYTIEVTFTRRDIARFYWPLAIGCLRRSGLLLNPRAWLFVVKYFIHLCLGGSR